MNFYTMLFMALIPAIMILFGVSVIHLDPCSELITSEIKNQCSTFISHVIKSTILGGVGLFFLFSVICIHYQRKEAKKQSLDDVRGKQ